MCIMWCEILLRSRQNITSKNPKVSLCFSNPFFFSSHNFADGPLLGYNVTFFTNAMVMSRFYESYGYVTFFTIPLFMSRFLLIPWSGGDALPPSVKKSQS